MYHSVNFLPKISAENSGANWVIIKCVIFSLNTSEISFIHIIINISRGCKNKF